MGLHIRIHQIVTAIQPYLGRAAVTLSTVAALLLWTSGLWAQDDIANQIQQAKSGFKPVSERELAESRDEIRGRMKDVANYLKPQTENGKRWLRYLRWDALNEAVTADQPTSSELSHINDTLKQLNRNENGLEDRRFRRLTNAVRRYRALAIMASWKDKAPEMHGRLLDALQRHLDEYRKEATPQNKQLLSEQLALIDASGAAPKLVRSIRREMARPNEFIEVSTSLIAASTDPINRREPVTDCILGTNVHSQTHTTGKVDVVSLPSDDKAVLEFRSKGHTWSNNTGFNGPAVIQSTSDTNFTAKKRVELSDEAFVGKSARANATTDLHLHSVSKNGGGLGSRLVSGIGWRRAQSSRGQAETIAANHAEGRIERKFNDELDDEVHKARKRYVDEYRRPLERSGEVPDYIRFSSGRNSITFEATQASHSQLGATSDPPAAPERHDVTMRLHESAVDNYSASVLGGATARQTKPEEDVKFNVKLPKWMDNMWKNRKTQATDSGTGKKEPFKQYALTLREGRPLSVNFARDQVKLTIHIAQLKSGDQTFENWDVTGTYRPELSEGRVLLNREGKLEMLPANFSGSLNARQSGERGNLEKELNRRSDEGHGFPKTIQFDPVKPEGKLADAGPLEFNRFASADGWLVIGLDRQRAKR
jgi:hypothetical protein